MKHQPEGLNYDFAGWQVILAKSPRLFCGRIAMQLQSTVHPVIPTAAVGAVQATRSVDPGGRSWNRLKTAISQPDFIAAAVPAAVPVPA